MFAFLPFVTIVFMVSTIAGSFEWDGPELGGMGDDVEEEFQEFLTCGA